MHTTKLTSLKKEQKELLIFLLVAFGLPFLMWIPMAILADLGKDVTFFAFTQMLYPAAGLMLAKLICDKDKSVMPETFFLGFLTLTGLIVLWCFAPFLLPDQAVETGTMCLIVVGALILISTYFVENGDVRGTYGLKSKNWGLSIRLLVLFVALHCTWLLLLLTITTTESLSKCSAPYLPTY